MATTTKDLLRKYPLANSPYLYEEQDIRHRQRLSRYLGLIDGTTEIDEATMQKLESAGFHLWAGFELLGKMNYVAQLGLRNVRNCVVSAGDEIYYAGDIPEFALDRLDQVRKIGFDLITVHSTNPLPIRRVRIEKVRKIDPIMVAWARNPDIRIIPLPFHKSRIRFGAKDLKGLVVAMWDMDKELKP